MRVLAVLYCYPPLLVPASICYLKLVVALQSQGVDIDLVTIDPETFASPGPIPLDPSLETVAPPVGRHYSVRSPETAFWIAALKRLDPQRRLTYRWLEPKKREWTRPALRQLEQSDISRYDLLLTCSQPHTNHLLGLELQQRYGIPWVAYFSDPWTDSPYIHYASDVVRRFNRQLEDRILARADRVLYTSEEMRDLIVARHDVLDVERTGVLPHCFVADWYGKAPAPPPEPFDGVRVLQTGSFYGPRTPTPVIEALVELRSRGSALHRLRIDSYGGMDERHVQAIADAGLEDVFRVGGFLPYLTTLSLMRQPDALLLVDAALESADARVFLPSKLIDYLGSGTPVLAITPQGSASARVVDGAGGVVRHAQDHESVTEAFAGLLEKGALEHRPSPEFVERYDHREVGARVRATLEEVTR